MNINGATRKQLLGLPVRGWSETTTKYDSLLILSEGKMHESGWGLIVIVGCTRTEPIEICSMCSDDISWKVNGEMRTDCVMPSRAMHFWSNTRNAFRVSAALSSIDILFNQESR